MKRKYAIKRLRSDLNELKIHPLNNLSAEPLDNNFLEWHCNISAPDDTCYHVILYFPEDYPFKVGLVIRIHIFSLGLKLFLSRGPLR